MNSICERCKGANINEGAKITTGVKITAAVMTGLILYCPFDPQKHACPYLPPEQHTHNEVYVPPQYRAISIAVATTAGSIAHDSVIDFFDDPERPGFKRYVLKF